MIKYFTNFIRKTNKLKMIMYKPCINIPETHRLIVFMVVMGIVLLTLILNAFWMEPLYK